MGGEVPLSGRSRSKRVGRGDTAVRRLGGDRVDQESHTALLSRGKDVHEVEVESRIAACVERGQKPSFTCGWPVS